MRSPTAAGRRSGRRRIHSSVDKEGTAIHPQTAASFYSTGIGKKTIVAATGVILYVYVLAHLAGNLLVYAGRGALNGYAAKLHYSPPALWAARAILLAAVAIHIVVSFQLWRLNRRVARTEGYVKKKNVPPAYASGTMIWTGPAIALFVIFHILHLTAGSVGLPYHELDAYGNVTQGFRIGWVAAVYIAAMLLLAMHLYHGFWSLFQTFGVSHARANRNLKIAAHVLAVVIAAGFISIPVMALAGVIG